MPRSDVRLTAGRAPLNETEQALCFLAGANSIFSSETEYMLTRAVPSPSYDADAELLKVLGLVPRAPFDNPNSDRATELARHAAESPCAGLAEPVAVS
jgi:biotin synthase